MMRLSSSCFDFCFSSGCMSFASNKNGACWLLSKAVFFCIYKEVTPDHCRHIIFLGLLRALKTKPPFLKKNKGRLFELNEKYGNFGFLLLCWNEGDCHCASPINTLFCHFFLCISWTIFHTHSTNKFLTHYFCRE